MYAYFKDCDPILSGELVSQDQMLPYFMMKTVGSMPGLPGLFIAGIFSGALSSVSSFVNSLAAVTIEDYIKPCCSKPMTDRTETLVTKFLAFFFGILCVALTYLAEQMSGILQASLTIFGVVGGPLLALFTLGMCCRNVTASAAFVSFFVSLAVGFWIGFGALANAPPPQALPRSVDGCQFNVTVQASEKRPEEDDVFYLYKLSYMYYAAFTWAIAIVLGNAISFIWKLEKPVSSRLIAPWFRDADEPDQTMFDKVEQRNGNTDSNMSSTRL